MPLHWGKPSNPGEFRFHTGTLLSKPADGKRTATKQYSLTEIVGLYGFSRRGLFLGWVKLGQRGFMSAPPEPYKGRSRIKSAQQHDRSTDTK